MTGLVELPGLLLDLARVLVQLPRVEVGLRLHGPKPLVQRMRARGRERTERAAPERARLRRAIGWLDARLPGGDNCYRRVLLEIALDRGAAGEPFRMGIDKRGGTRSGHAWLGDERGARPRYDVELEM